MGWLYKGTDVMPWCARCGTGISQHEIVTDGYQTVTHDSVFYVKIPTGRTRKRGAAGLDDDAMDADQQCRRGRWPRTGPT